MASSFLSDVLTTSKLTPQSIEISQQTINNATSKIISNDFIKKTFSSRTNQSQKFSIKQLIDKSLLKLNSADVELNLRKAKLREAKRLKKQLEAKLSTIAESIEGLNPFEDMEQNPKLNLQNSRVRQEFFNVEKKKSEENTKVVHNYFLEQQKRAKKIKKHIQELEKMIDEDKKAKQVQEEEIKRKKEEQYQSELERMQQKKLQRQRELEEIQKRKQEFEEIKKQKPLFVKIEEKFKSDIEMPELEKRKAELAKKRMLYQPIRQDQLSEHAKWYESLKQEQAQKTEKEITAKKLDFKVRSNSNLSTTWSVKIIEQEKQQKEAQNLANLERLKMIEKKTRYAEIVKEMFSPTIDKFKQQELQERIDKIKNPIPKRAAKTLENTVEENRPEPEKKKKPFKKAKKVSTPPAEPEKEVKVVDYLGERRKQREEYEKEHPQEDLDLNFNWENELQDAPVQEKIKKIKQKELLIEKKIKADLSNPTSVKALQQSASVDNFLIGSIKAKLQVLDTMAE
ncbi:unnamed protein product [Blepharisma stoltei]|uniref:Uncharacterized protein n=1 Tax=Blepharisma stoltei TaxID=1481888 RepID=A0AAU9JZY3_9CILI|nr:unnamed protein product [Blepharisma stoltei]